jgi:hypothetical protein
MRVNIIYLQASLITFKPLFNPKFGKIKRKAVFIKQKLMIWFSLLNCMFVTSTYLL